MQKALPPTELLPLWQEFLASTGTYAEVRFYESFYLADSEQVANELGALVMAGVKRATASLVRGMEEQKRSPAVPGDLSIVTDWSGKPLCVIETIETNVVPFDEVTQEFSATEGEGDRTLEYWRRVHWAYFSRECRQLGRDPTPQMPVLCESFKVVY